MSTKIYRDMTEITGDVDVQGELTALASVNAVNTSSTYSLSESDVKGRVWFTSEATDFVLPNASANLVGASCIIYSLTSSAVTVDTLTSASAIRLDGTLGGGGKKITSASEAGNYVSLVCDSSTSWTVVGRSGTWTMES